MTVYKPLSALLAILLVIGGVFFVIERNSNAKHRRSLNNEIAKLEGIIKETKSAYSRRAIEVSNLRVDNKKLRKKISDRDETVLALTEASLKWKSKKHIEVKDARESVLDVEGHPKELTAICTVCFAKNRLRVDFEKIKNELKISGYTLTSPPEAVVDLEWTKDLNLSLILTKNKDNTFRIYLDTNDSNVAPVKLKLTVDSSILDKSWYEKISLSGAVTAGEGVASFVGMQYDVLNNWTVGPLVIFQYDGSVLSKTFGVSGTWYPFR